MIPRGKFEWEPSRADQVFLAKRGQRKIFRFTLLRNGVPVDLTGRTIEFAMARPVENPPLGGPYFTTEIPRQPATIVNALAGEGLFDASAALMTVPVGDHACDVELVEADGTRETFPGGIYYMRCIVGEAIGG